MNIALTIDRVVLEGLSLGPGEQRRLDEALRAELTRLLAERGPPPATAPEIAHLHAPPLPAAAQDGAALGVALARSLWRGLGGAP